MTNNDNGWGERFNNLSTQLIGVGTIALVGTCIRVWAGMDVIQTQIATLAKSDTQQDVRIESIRSEINTLRVQVGVLRAIVTPTSINRP